MTAISAAHIVRCTADQAMRLMRSLLATAVPDAPLAAERGEADWPHAVFSLSWPLARSDSFQARGEPVSRRSVEVDLLV